MTTPQLERRNPALGRWWCAAVLAVLVAVAAAAPARATFTQEGSPISVGTDPYGVVAADFTGDGRPDVATVNGTSSTLSVLVREATGGFTQEAGSPYNTGSGPDFAATGDFNGDGRPDVAVANYVSGDVTVLLRQPGGGFAPQAGSPYPAASASSVATADFNADGRLDLAVPSYGGNFVTILLGQAGGGFAAEGATPSGGSSPRNLAIADFNGDGRPDLAVTNLGSGTVTVLLRQAGQGFAAEGSPITVGSTPAGILAKDFNGDGLPDLAVANSGSDTVSILLRTAGGGFVAEAGSPLAVDDAPIGLASADLNADGLNDLVVTNNAASSVSVLLRQAAGGFVADAGSPIPTTTGAYGVTTADFNADGLPDLAVTSDQADTLTVLINAFTRPIAPPLVAAPVCTAQSATAPRARGLTITLACSGAAAGGFRILQAPRGGTLTGPDAGGRVTYTPNLQFAGSDRFTYQASGPGGTSAPQTVTLTVPAALPVPTTQKTTNITRSSGTVLIKVPGAKTPVRLTADAQVPLGTIIDTRKGRVTITLTIDAAGHTQSGDFYAGQFQVLQTPSPHPVGVMRLVGGRFSAKAPKDDTKPAAKPIANSAKSRKPVRRLWGDAHGAFRTTGRTASATVRGTKWLISDYATSTTITVTRGTVAVRDYQRHRTVLVHAGHSYSTAR